MGSDPARAPEVAVVVPVYGTDNQLATQLRAVLAQRATFPFEVVVSCNGPDEAARRAVAQVLDDIGDARARMVWSGDRKGAAHARNVGAMSTEAEVIAFCDADDEVAPGWLQALTDPVTDAIAVGGHLDEDRYGAGRQRDWRPAATPNDLPSFLDVPYAVSANFALSRNAFESAGGFDTSLTRCEDIAFSWVLQRRGVKITYEPDAVVYYRHRDTLASFVVQHYLYGRGMAQVLWRYPMPGTGGAHDTAASGIGMLRPNRQVKGRRGFVGVFVRRGSLALGRVVGLVDERVRHRDLRRRHVAPTAQGNGASEPHEGRR